MLLSVVSVVVEQSVAEDWPCDGKNRTQSQSGEACGHETPAICLKSTFLSNSLSGVLFYCLNWKSFSKES